MVCGYIWGRKTFCFGLIYNVWPGNQEPFYFAKSVHLCVFNFGNNKSQLIHNGFTMNKRSSKIGVCELQKEDIYRFSFLSLSLALFGILHLNFCVCLCAEGEGMSYMSIWPSFTCTSDKAILNIVLSLKRITFVLGNANCGLNRQA